ncbi:hypothetical protein OZX65_00535 [Leuconostocaceae bacterium ESL0723]|nr:hypothetical protein OZX65_00535 [Leuconostocaceae bacterium ESL0723]
MYYSDGQFYQLKIQQIVFYFIVSLTINAFGNGLSVASNMGSAPWTAAAANLANVTGGPIAVFLLLISTSVACANLVISGNYNWPRFFGNIAFGAAFSVLVGLFATFFRHLGVENLPIVWRIIVDIFAVTNVGIGISIYQRVNLIMHPIDDLTNILRFKYFHGNPSKAQISNFIFAVGISVVCFIFSHKLVALNIGTAFSFFCQGKIIGFSDVHVFKHLVHGDLSKIHKSKVQKSSQQP